MQLPERLPVRVEEQNQVARAVRHPHIPRPDAAIDRHRHRAVAIHRNSHGSPRIARDIPIIKIRRLQTHRRGKRARTEQQEQGADGEGAEQG